MDDVFKIFIEQLRDGHEEKIHESLAPTFLEIDEPDLAFVKPVELDGVAYVADHELILRWDIEAEAQLSCSICNEKVKVPLHIHHFYASEPLAEITSGVYNFKNLLRETILLEVPPFAECQEGDCPKRKEFNKYLKKSLDPTNDQEEGYQPFANLDWDDLSK